MLIRSSARLHPTTARLFFRHLKPLLTSHREEREEVARTAKEAKKCSQRICVKSRQRFGIRRSSENTLVSCPMGPVVAIRRRKGQLLAMIRGWGRWYSVESVSIQYTGVGRQLLS